MTTDLEAIKDLLDDFNVPTMVMDCTLSVYGRVALVIERDIVTPVEQTTARDDFNKVKRHTRKIRNSPADIYAMRVSLGIVGQLREQKTRAAVRVAQTENGK